MSEWFPNILQLGQNTNKESDKIQIEKMQKWQNIKKHNTNNTEYKCDKIQIWQNTNRQNTNVTKNKKTEYKCDKIQKDRIQIR